MNPQDWSGSESVLAVSKVKSVIDLLNETFSGDSLVQVPVGITYLAVGCNGGKSVSRFLLFLPYYNPSTCGCNFGISHPYVFARGFPAAFSLEFYAWLDSEWTKSVTQFNDGSELMMCSPTMFCKFDNIENAEFWPVPWSSYQNKEDAMVAKNSGVEYLIRVPVIKKRNLKLLKE